MVKGPVQIQAGLRRKNIPTVISASVLKVKQQLSFYGGKERNGVVEGRKMTWCRDLIYWEDFFFLKVSGLSEEVVNKGGYSSFQCSRVGNVPGPGGWRSAG